MSNLFGPRLSGPDSATHEDAWKAAIDSGDIARISQTARRLTELKSTIDTSFRLTVCDKLWRPIGAIGGDLIEGSGTDPVNDAPSGRLVVKGASPLVPLFMDCRKTMVGVEVETSGYRQAFYVEKHSYKYENSAWTGGVELRGIWDILNYLVIWPSWYLPIQAQPISHAIYWWALRTVCEQMVAECAIRIQSGWLEAVNNLGSLNPDLRAAFGAIFQALKRDGLTVKTFGRMLKTPIYVKRTNPFLDTSPGSVRTVRMETCGQVIKDITRSSGVVTDMMLWRPGMPQPDRWANLDQPTYVFSTADHSQIEGPTKTVLDSMLRTTIDLGGSLGGLFNPIIKQVDGMDGVFHAPALGVNFRPPYAIVMAPDQGEDSNILACEINDHSPEGWQHIIGGRSPKWVCAPRETGGHRPIGQTMTQRSDERNVCVADRFTDDCHRLFRHPQRSAFRLHEQRVPGFSARAGIRSPRRGGPLPPGHRTDLPDRIGPLQRRDPVRVPERDLRRAGLHERAGDIPQRRPIRAWP